MSLPVAPPLSITRNRPYTLAIPCTLAGVALDVSAYTWAGHVRPAVGVDPVVEMTLDISTPTRPVLSLSAAQTAALPAYVAIGVDVTISGQKSQILRALKVPVVAPVEA